MVAAWKHDLPRVMQSTSKAIFKSDNIGVSRAVRLANKLWVDESLIYLSPSLISLHWTCGACPTHHRSTKSSMMIKERTAYPRFHLRQKLNEKYGRVFLERVRPLDDCNLYNCLPRSRNNEVNDDGPPTNRKIRKASAQSGSHMIQ